MRCVGSKKIPIDALHLATIFLATSVIVHESMLNAQLWTHSAIIFVPALAFIDFEFSAGPWIFSMLFLVMEIAVFCRLRSQIFADEKTIYSTEEIALNSENGDKSSTSMANLLRRFPEFDKAYVDQVLTRCGEHRGKAAAVLQGRQQDQLLQLQRPPTEAFHPDCSDCQEVIYPSPATMDDHTKVGGRMWAGETDGMELDIPPSTTVAQMVDILAERSGLEPRSMQLSYGGRILNAEQTLRECVNQSGERLQLVHGPIIAQANPLVESRVPKI